MTIFVLVLGFIAGVFGTALVLSLLEEKDEEMFEAERARQLQIIAQLRDDLRASERDNAKLREQHGKLFDQWAKANGWAVV